MIVFHELEWDSTRSIPPAPTYDRCRQWIAEMLRLSGTPDIGMGARLHRALIHAGLPMPFMRMQTSIGGGEECMERLQVFADLVCSLLPGMERPGVAEAGEVEAATLTERLRREVLQAAA